MNQSFTALIIDDEPLLIEVLSSILKEFCPEIKIIGTSQDAFDAKFKIESLSPQILFLDINMPKVNGFELLNSLNNKNFHVIFISAYDQYAINALKEGAVDYILKPVLSSDVINAVNKVKSIINSQQQPAESDLHKEDINTNKLVIQNNNSYLFLEYEDIIWLEADHNYTKIYLTSGKIISSAKPIKVYEGLLPGKLFFRIHKSYIINTKHISRYFRDDKGAIVVLNNDVNLRVSQPKQSEFRKFLISANK